MGMANVHLHVGVFEARLGCEVCRGDPNLEMTDMALISWSRSLSRIGSLIDDRRPSHPPTTHPSEKLCVTLSASDRFGTSKQGKRGNRDPSVFRVNRFARPR